MNKEITRYFRVITKLATDQATVSKPRARSLTLSRVNQDERWQWND
jgi:hypothetical protein